MQRIILLKPVQDAIGQREEVIGLHFFSGLGDWPMTLAATLIAHTRGDLAVAH